MMSLLDEMRAEREANAAKITARLGRLLGGSKDATTRDDAELSPSVNRRRQLATTDENQKLSQSVHHCIQSATTDDNQKLSPSVHSGAQPETAIETTRLPQSLESRDGKRLARLWEQYRQGHGMRSETEQAVEMTIAFGVSLRTAQRHIQRGTLPAAERRWGADGKRHPLRHAGGIRSKVERELRLARQALARAAQVAATDGLQGRERDLLKQIQVMVAEMQKGPRR